MGRQARARRQRAQALASARAPTAAGAPASASAPAPWYRNPWKAGLAGAALFGGLAVVRLLTSEEPASTPPPRPSSMRDTVPEAGLVEVEPNDDTGSAQRLPLPAQIEAALRGGDRDSFRVVLDQSGGHLLHAWIDGPAGLDLTVLRDGATKAHVRTPTTLRALGVARGEYVLVVTRAASAVDGAVPDDYRLHVATTPWAPGLEWEPNDTPEAATRVEGRDATGTPPKVEPSLMDARAIGWWSGPEDVDCFELPLVVPPAGAVVRLALTPPSAVTARLRVLDTGDREAGLARRVLVDVTGAVGSPVVLPALGARSWERSYVVCGQATSGAIASVDGLGRYVLDARVFTPEGPFEFEPNETWAMASALPRDVTLAGYLTRGDVDMYRLSAGPASAVEVTVDPPAEVAAELILENEGGVVLARQAGEPGRRVALTAAGVAKVSVRAHEGGSDSARYLLSATSKPAVKTP